MARPRPRPKPRPSRRRGSLARSAVHFAPGVDQPERLVREPIRENTEPGLAGGEPVTALPAQDPRAWTRIAERGSMGALRFIRWYYRTCGRRLTIAFLTPV